MQLCQALPIDVVGLSKSTPGHQSMDLWSTGPAQMQEADRLGCCAGMRRLNLQGCMRICVDSRTAFGYPDGIPITRRMSCPNPPAGSLFTRASQRGDSCRGRPTLPMSRQPLAIPPRPLTSSVEPSCSIHRFSGSAIHPVDLRSCLAREAMSGFNTK
jgi:hypothetical protein